MDLHGDDMREGLGKPGDLVEVNDVRDFPSATAEENTDPRTILPFDRRTILPFLAPPDLSTSTIV